MKQLRKKFTLVRSYYAFLGEEAAKIENFTPNITMTTVTATKIRTATVVIRTATVAIASATQVVSNANRNIHIQNLGSCVGAGGGELAPATRGCFSFGFFTVQRK